MPQGHFINYFFNFNHQQIAFHSLVDKQIINGEKQVATATNGI